MTSGIFPTIMFIGFKNIDYRIFNLNVWLLIKRYVIKVLTICSSLKLKKEVNIGLNS